MPRIPRNFIPTSYFHVMSQGINKNFIFNTSSDIKFYIKSMYQLLKEHPIKIIAYCIMNNHTHLLIKTSDVKELSKYMQRLNTKYAKYYNNKYKRVGYVFKDRYKAEGIYNISHLNNCIKYIYNNPVKAGICKTAKEYPYSNYKEINVDIDENYFFIDTDEDVEIIRKNVIHNFLLKNNINLYNNQSKLSELVVLLKEKYNIPLRKIARELNMNREKIRKIYEKYH